MLFRSHAERLVQRMLALGVGPGASQLQPVDTAADLAGLLRIDVGLEADLIQHYAEAVRFCVLIQDSDNESFFRALWQEEQQHGHDLIQWQRDLAGSRRPLASRASF